MNIHYYSRKELESMSNKQLLDLAKSVSIPADSNWKTEQIIAIIEYYQEHNSQNIGMSIYHFLMKYLNGSIAKGMFMMIAVVGIIYSKSTESCPTGICNESNDSVNDSIVVIVDAINSISNEFSSVTKKSTDRVIRVQQRYNDLMDSIQTLERLYTNCQQNMSKIKQQNQMVLLGLSDELEKCWRTCSDVV